MKGIAKPNFVFMMFLCCAFFLGGIFFAKQYTSGNQSLPEGNSPSISMLAVDTSEKGEWSKTLDSVSLPTPPIVAPPPLKVVERKIEVVESSTADVSAYREKIREYEMQVMSLEDKRKVDAEKIIQLEINMKTLNEKWATHVQKTVNEIAALMVDRNYKSSLYNDIFLNLILPSPMYYTQEMIDNDKEIGIRTAYLWPSLICHSLEQYVKAGWISSKGEDCSAIESFSTTLKKAN